MANNIFLGLGSNKGDRERFIREAVKKLKNFPGIEVLKCSSLYETTPYGNEEQDNFLNLVIRINSEHEPEYLLEIIKNIEEEMGRQTTERWGPREIDIDILFYDNVIVNKENLTIPHEDLTKRGFVLYPLNEIAPELIHPVYDKRISELLSTDLEKTIIGIINFTTD